MSDDGKLQNYSVDQAAGAIVLVLGAVASLLLVIWQSKCHCKINCCYLFQCERRPPSEEEMKSLNDQIKERKEKEKMKENDKIQDEKLIPNKIDKNKNKNDGGDEEIINLDDKV